MAANEKPFVHAKTLADMSLLMPRASSSPLDVNEGHEDASDQFFGGWLAEHLEHVGTPEPWLVAKDVGAAELQDTERREIGCRQLTKLATKYLGDDVLIDHEHTQKMSRKFSARSTPALLASPQPEQRLERPCAGLLCCQPADILGALRRAFCCGESAARGGAPLAFDCKDSAVVIFDWDDTLFPTSFLTKAVIPDLQSAQLSSVTPGSPHYEPLKQHGHLLKFVLQTARKVARVAIVTLSLSPWVEASARYLPDMDIDALLTELDIPVYYSREHVNDEVKKWVAELDRSKVDESKLGMDVDVISRGALRIRKISNNGAADRWNMEHPEEALRPGDYIVAANGSSENLVNSCRTAKHLSLDIVRQEYNPKTFMDAKAKDMDSCLGKFYAGDARHKNVVSVGDSVTERDALKSLLLQGAAESGTGNSCLCKTVNLLDDPTPDQLANELRVLMVWLPRMVAYARNFDLTMDCLDNLERELFSK